MQEIDRKRLNRRIGYLRNAVLKLDEETYRTIVSSIDEKSGGYLRNCDDEHANLILLTLQRLTAQSNNDRRSGSQDAQRKIAKLGYLLGWSWRDIARFCEKETGKSSTRSCSSKELTKVINGMIAVIDYQLEKGILRLSPETLKQYYRYTKHSFANNVQEAI